MVLIRRGLGAELLCGSFVSVLVSLENDYDFETSWLKTLGYRSIPNPKGASGDGISVCKLEWHAECVSVIRLLVVRVVLRQISGLVAA